MSYRPTRRSFLRAAALGAAAGAATPSALFAQGKARKEDEVENPLDVWDPENNWSEPNGLTGDPLVLPDWTHGDTSSSTDTMLMFRGNPTHTFYGTGPLSENPTLQWSQELARFHTKLRGRKVTWTGTGWSGQPVKIGGYVFVGGQGGYAYAFDAATGEIKWRYKGKRMFKGSICAFENVLFMGNTDNYYRGVDAATGKELWKFDTGTDIDSSGVVVGGKLYVAGESGYLRCLNPRTGKHFWKTDLGGTGKGTKGGSNGSETSPAIADGEVYAATYDGFLYCVDQKSGEIKWRCETGDDTDASPVIVGDRVYVAAEEKNPKLFCFDRSKEGAEVWSLDNRKGWWSTPAVVDDKLYIGGNDSKVYCLDAKTGKKVWVHDAGSSVWSSPAVVDGKVVVGTRSRYLIMLDAKTGKRIWRGDMGGRTLSTPIVVDGAIYVGSSAGKFQCFK